MFTLNDTSARDTSLADFPAPAGQVIGQAFDDALETNPVPLFMLSRELYGARRAGPRLPRDQALEQAQRSGVAVTVPEDGITQEALGILIQRRRDQAARDLLFSRRDSAAATAGMFAAGFAGALLDPLNVALGFVPVLSGTRYAARLAEAGTAGSRAALRVGIGAAEGLVGAAAVEVPTIALRRDLQDDYSLYDSLANIAFGTVASAAIRGVSGAARDAWLGLARAQEIDRLRAVEPEVWQAMREAAETAQERRFWADLEQGFQRGEGIPPALRDAFRRERFDLESREAADEFAAGMGDYRAERSRIVAAADEAIERRFQRERETLLAAGIEPDEALRQAFARTYPETERRLLSAAEVGALRVSEALLADARARIAQGRGMVLVPRTDAEVAAAISSTTHAQALKAAVAQAIEGRRIDVEPVLRRDPAFGPARMSPAEVRARARVNQAPESMVGADREASRRAAETIVVVRAGPSEATPAKGAPPRAKPPRSREQGEAAAEAAEAAMLRDETQAAHEEFFAALADYSAGAPELLAAGLARADAADVSLVAQALDIDAPRVEALRIQFRGDDAAFVAAIREIVDGRNADGQAREGGQAREPAPGAGAAAGEGPGRDARRGAEAADPEVARAEGYARAYEALGGCARAGEL